MAVFTVWTKDDELLLFSKIATSMMQSPFATTAGMARYKSEDGYYTVFKIELSFKNIWPYLGIILMLAGALLGRIWLVIGGIVPFSTVFFQTNLFHYLMFLARVKKEGWRIETRMISNEKMLGMITDGTARDIEIPER